MFRALFINGESQTRLYARGKVANAGQYHYSGYTFSFTLNAN